MQTKGKNNSLIRNTQPFTLNSVKNLFDRRQGPLKGRDALEPLIKAAGWREEVAGRPFHRLSTSGNVWTATSFRTDDREKENPGGMSRDKEVHGEA